ncbi:hypothetical protein DRE_02342 [Drechslerella stenobrocha 248]|uniref:C2H2-type domain-containing protein n=1 Tax=Drechslerella stenobrocha 248 TaxID=1043628 RepID=W7I7C5_9PEZI|nr:hypothetical protein DRE_02342 [Drechslerella stenobrocha 248]
MGPQRLLKTRNRKRDLDQIATDIKHPSRLRQHLSTLPLDELPALGQLYCTPCARFLESQHALDHHVRSKTHKKRVRRLEEPAYSHAEADAAIGRGTDNGARFKVVPADVIGAVSRNATGVVSAMEVDSVMAQDTEPTPQLVQQERLENEDL